MTYSRLIERLLEMTFQNVSDVSVTLTDVPMTFR
jgi:hypothetical protein